LTAWKHPQRKCSKMARMSSPSPMFNEPPQEKSFPAAAVAIAAIAVALLVVLFVLMEHGHQSGGDAGYAQNVVLTDVAVSAADNMAGGTTTYVDGHLTNKGSATVTGVTVEATFLNNDGSTQVQTDVAKGIRTRDPLDLEPLAADPVAPGAGADFRLIFEGLKDGWNQQAPRVKVISVTTK
jgi:hypothetical protein